MFVVGSHSFCQILYVRTLNERCQTTSLRLKSSSCTGKLDRLQLFSYQNPTKAFLDHPAFHSVQSHRLKQRKRFQPYSRVHWFESRDSSMKFCIESWPRVGWIAPYRVTLYADDATGLSPEEVFGVLELLLGGFKLTLVEIAFDFEGTLVDRKFVRRFGLFGRSRPTPPGTKADYWGTRKGAKFVKCYSKSEIGKFRLELELRARFLRRHRIKDPYDFQNLAQLLPHRHIWFAKIDDLKLIDHLRRRGVIGEEVISICQRLDPLKRHIHAALSHLRRNVRLNNVRRVLTPLRANRLVREALAKWSANWARPRHALDESSEKK
jgi:hypothetical protein